MNAKHISTGSSDNTITVSDQSGLIGFIIWNGNTPSFRLKAGKPHTNLPESDFCKAALYLTRERAAVSCRCQGYLIEK